MLVRELIRSYKAYPSSDLILRAQNTDVTFLNPFSYLQLRDASYFHRFLCFTDSIVMALIMRMFGYDCYRVSFDGGSLAHQLFANVKEGVGIGVVGASREDILLAVTRLNDDYPHVNFDFISDGFFEESRALEVCDAIIRSGVSYVVVGMGAGRQEDFLCLLRDQGWTGVGITCGGFLTQTAARGSATYPLLINKFHLRWLYRMMFEPHVLHRTVINYPPGLFYLIKHLILMKR